MVRTHYFPCTVKQRRRSLKIVSQRPPGTIHTLLKGKYHSQAYNCLMAALTFLLKRFENGEKDSATKEADKLNPVQIPIKKSARLDVSI